MRINKSRIISDAFIIFKKASLPFDNQFSTLAWHIPGKGKAMIQFCYDYESQISIEKAHW